MSSIIGLTISLILIVSLVIMRANYGVALIIGAIILGLSLNIQPKTILKIFIESITDQMTISLMIIVSLIPILASCMRESGLIDKMIADIKTILPGRYVLAIMPAIMGALPMIGGALLSAPLIDDESNRLGLTSEDKSFINVWFRHWNFLVYPLASSLILASSLAGVSLYALISFHIIPTLIYIMLGYILSIHRIEDEWKPEETRNLRAILTIPISLSPILLAVFLNIAGVHMAISLAVGIILTLILGRVQVKEIPKIIGEGFSWKIPFAMVGVMFFREMIDYADIFSEILPNAGVIGGNVVVLLVFMGLAIGLATAMPSLGIAIIFSMAQALIGELDLAITSLLYSSLVFSYIISPMHLCLILTVEYYKAKLHLVYRKLIPASIISYTTFIISSIIMEAILQI